MPQKTPGSLTIRDRVTGLTATVENIDGKDKLLVADSSALGSDIFPDSFFVITAAGAIADTIRIVIAAGSNDTTSPDANPTIYDETYTLVAGDVGDELTLRDNAITFFNAQAAAATAFLNFQKATDNPIIHMTSTKRGNFFDRLTAGDVAVTVTGTTTVSLGNGEINFDVLKQRNKLISLSRNPDSPHNLGISDSFITGATTNTQIGNVGNRLNTQSSIFDIEVNSTAAISPSGALETGELIRLIGGNFETGALQTNIWDIEEINGGTTTSVTGEAVLSTNTTANGAARLQSVRRARFVTATFNKAHHAIQMINPTNTDVIRSWGMYDPINNFASGDGVFWENDSNVYTLKRRKAGIIEDTVTEAQFNGTTALVKDGNVHIYEITFNAGSALFMQDRKTIHTMTFFDAVGYETVHLFEGAECININGNTTNNTLKTRGFACSRIGAPSSRPDFFRINTATTGIIKNSPGTLEKIIIPNPGQGNPIMTVFNNSAASGEIITIIDLTIANGGFDFGVDFDVGLSFITTGSGFEILVVFN